MFSAIHKNLTGSEITTTPLIPRERIQELRWKADQEPNNLEAREQYLSAKKFEDVMVVIDHAAQPTAGSLVEFLATAAVAGAIGVLASYSSWTRIPVGMLACFGLAKQLEQKQWVGAIYKSCIIAGVVFTPGAFNSAANLVGSLV